MSRGMHRRLDRVAGDARVTAWHVWYQDTQGADAFTSDNHPGVTLTEAELGARVDPPSVGRIVVYRVDMSPADLDAGEGDA